MFNTLNILLLIIFYCMLYENILLYESSYKFISHKTAVENIYTFSVYLQSHKYLAFMFKDIYSMKILFCRLLKNSYTALILPKVTNCFSKNKTCLKFNVFL